MTADQIRKLNILTATDAAFIEEQCGGTGEEESLRNLLLREIAAQLAEINAYLRRSEHP